MHSPPLLGSPFHSLLKALNKSNERVLALGSCFNEQADSHLICVQTEDGQYQTQAISIHSQPRRGEREHPNIPTLMSAIDTNICCALCLFLDIRTVVEKSI
uniref:Smad anchor for receptor activation-like C-terminal domain-containing protein n=1 Tax=Cyprinus carpio carpio TaxID=630221 RepID=A0A9J7XCM2_CYPCA